MLIASMNRPGTGSHWWTTPPWVVVSVHAYSGPTDTVVPVAQFMMDVVDGVAVGNVNEQVKSVPSTRISIRCIPFGRVPSLFRMLAEKLSTQPMSVHALGPSAALLHPPVRDAAATTDNHETNKPIRMPKAYAAVGIVAIL